MKWSLLKVKVRQLIFNVDRGSARTLKHTSKAQNEARFQINHYINNNKLHILYFGE